MAAKKPMRLAASFMANLQAMDWIKRGIKVRDAVVEVAKSLRVSQQIAVPGSSTDELREHDAEVCEEAARLLERYGTEVTRLRLSILSHLDGRMTSHELRDATRTWNDGEPAGG